MNAPAMSAATGRKLVAGKEDPDDGAEDEGGEELNRYNCGMNPKLQNLQPYPFEKLKTLLGSVTPEATRKPLSLGIGEPQHPTPQFIKDALVAGMSGLANYPTTGGSAALRSAIAAWLTRRYALRAVNAEAHVLPVNGSREALFAFAQTVIDAKRPNPTVVAPNPFYQIYEGAATLAGARTVFAPVDPARNFAVDLNAVPPAVWRDTQLLFLCSPGNPTGAVMTLDDWREAFALSDQYGFVIASDECYSEIYFDEAAPPLGALQAAQALGRDFTRLIMFSSLSKRSNVPGMRSGFVAGDPALIKAFLLYRTYHGSAMSPAVQAASTAAWGDEAHVLENRRLYSEKFDAVLPLLSPVMEVSRPDAAFYLWARVPGGDDAAFARDLFKTQHVTVLPGSYMARDSEDGRNPGRGYVRMALVAEPAPCIEAAQRIAQFCSTHS
jgi:N-succinyldiaminopimelate aminotransferase